MNFIGTLQKSRFWRVKAGFGFLGLGLSSPVAVGRITPAQGLMLRAIAAMANMLHPLAL